MEVANVTLYAVWLLTYTVTYDGNGSTGGLVPADHNSYQTGVTITVPGNTGNLVKTGYIFDGWWINGSLHLPGSILTMGSANVMASAVWVAAPTAEVDILVVLQGGSRPNPSGRAVPIIAKVFTPGSNVATATPVYSFDLTTAVSGTAPNLKAVAQATGVTPANYDILVMTAHALSNVKRNVPITAPSTAVYMGIMLEGNANDNGIVNIQDFGILALAYGKAVGTAGYDARVNFDCNNLVNIQDFGMLAVNFSKTGPVEVP